MKKTISSLINSIPGRFNTKADLSTPVKALEFLKDEDACLFYKASDVSGFYDCHDFEDMLFIIRCGHKAMYVFHTLFGECSDTTSDEYKHYTGKFGPVDSFRKYEEFHGDDLIDEGMTDDISWIEEEDLSYGVYIYNNFVGNDFRKFIDYLKKICIETNDWITVAYYGKEEKPQYECRIDESGNATTSGKYVLTDDNGASFAAGLVIYISLFGCDSFDETDEYGPEIDVVMTNEFHEIPEDTGLHYAYSHEEELAELNDVSDAVVLVKKYPVLIRFIPEKIAVCKEVVFAFIDANSGYVDEYYNIRNEWMIGNHTFLSGAGLRGECAHLQLNGIVPNGNFGCDGISSEVKESWNSDEEIFDVLLASSMNYICELTDDTFERFDHKKNLEANSQYVYILRRYFMNVIGDNEKGKKLKEHILRKYSMNAESDNYNVSLLATLDFLRQQYPEFIKYLSNTYNARALVSFFNEDSKDSMSKFMLSIPKEDRDCMIKCNMILACCVKNELNPDEEIVDHICKYCPCAGDLLSDEIITVRGLKRTALDVFDACDECGIC